MNDSLKAPFPWMGGKSRVAEMVWQRFGDVANYVEPFFGSGAVLLGRPTEQGIETVNDLDCMVANFWRSVKLDPDAVADAADWPVNEADQHARHRWLCGQADFRERMKVDPDYFDAKIAGWWVWGQCIWIGSGWCGVKLDGEDPSRQLPHLGDAGKGIHRKRPHLGNAGKGLVRVSSRTSATPEREFLLDYMMRLSERLRSVRVCCGDWARVCGPTPTIKQGLTGAFLDPPYADTAERTSDLYASDSLTVAHDVREWAIEWGEHRDMRIALCGYEGEHVMPVSWDCVPWKAKGGYGSQSNGANENAKRERIWFSPHCLPAMQPELFRDERIFSAAIAANAT